MTALARRCQSALAAARPRIIAVTVGIGVVALVLGVSGYSLSDLLTGTIDGAVTAPGAWQSTIRWTVVYVIIGAGVLVTIRAGFLNLGSQGQFYAGATASVWVALRWDDGPTTLVIVTSVIAGALAGALWVLVPAVLRLRWGTNEVITTLMFNFLGVLLLRWVTTGPLKNPNGSGESLSTETVARGLRISSGSGVSATTVAIALAVAAATWILVARTRFGVLSAITGRNQLMAMWQGIDVRRTGLVSFLVSGATAGLAGTIEVLGPNGRVSSGFSPDIGFTAILVAIVGGLSVAGLILAALFFGALQAALLYLPIVSDLPPSALNLLRGTVALLVTVSTLGCAVARHRTRRFRTTTHGHPTGAALAGPPDVGTIDVHR